MNNEVEPSAALLEVELRKAALEMAGECLVCESDTMWLTENGSDANCELCTHPKADGRENRSLHDDVIDAHGSLLVNPLRLGT